MKIRSMVCSLLFLGAFTGIASLRAENHIVLEEIRTRMGNTTPPRRTEAWIGKDKTYLLSANLITISRYDLQKRWFILPARQRYFEEPMEEIQKPPAKETGAERIQSAGFNYQPTFDWTVRDSGKTDMVDGRKCRILILEGEADYARQTREMCVSREIAIDAKSYFQKIVRPGLDPPVATLYDQTPDLSEGMVLKMRMVTEPAIGPTMVLESRTIAMEAGSPPEGIYEIPANFQKVSSVEELFK